MGGLFQPLHALSHEQDRLVGGPSGAGSSGAGGSVDRVSTRVYIILAALTGMAILAAFAVQLIVSRQ